MQGQKLMVTSGVNWLDFSWPSVAVCVVFAVILLAASASQGTLTTGYEKMCTFIAGVVSAPHDADRVLVITNDPSHQLQVVATLSPRGLEPLLAKNLQEAAARMAQHPHKVRLAVIDEELGERAAVIQALGAALPADRIVRIARSSSPQAIGQMLLDRM